MSSGNEPLGATAMINNLNNTYASDNMCIRDYHQYMTLARFTPQDICNWLHTEEGIVGQDRACKAIASVIYSHFHFPKLPKQNLLLIGSTGCGKSEIMKACQRFFQKNLPGRNGEEMVRCIDSTQFNATGYKSGTKLVDVLRDVPIPFGLFVFWDEFDKLVEEHWASTGNGSWSVSKLIQEQLLTTLDHQVLSLVSDDSKHFTVDTGRISIITMGAFTDIREKKRKAKSHRSIGFSSSADTAVDVADEITTEDLIDYGMMPEVSGRLHPVLMDDVTPDMMYHIAQKTVQEMNSAGESLYKVTVPEPKLRLLAEEAFSKGLGGRYIRNMLLELFHNAVYADPCRNIYVL